MLVIIGSDSKQKRIFKSSPENSLLVIRQIDNYLAYHQSVNFSDSDHVNQAGLEPTAAVSQRSINKNHNLRTRGKSLLRWHFISSS